VITPTTTLLTSRELGERIRRGAIRHIVADSDYAGRFADESQECTQIAVGSPVSGWRPYDESNSAATLFEPDGPTSANDPLQLYFTSGTTVSRSWLCTVTRRTQSVIYQQCIGSGCVQVTPEVDSQLAKPEMW
jgi:acetyl-CoA synthetase